MPVSYWYMFLFLWKDFIQMYAVNPLHFNTSISKCLCAFIAAIQHNLLKVRLSRAEGRIWAESLSRREDDGSSAADLLRSVGV